VLIPILAGVAVEVVAATEPPEGGGYCSTAAHDARRADLAFERGGLPPAIQATDRHCQR
jgi:hypothetical protein